MSKKSRTHRLRILMMLTCIGLVFASCSKPMDHPKTYNASGSFHDQVVLTEKDGTVWVPVKQAVQSLGFQLHETRNRTLIGYTDPMYEVQTDNLEATSLGSPVTLSQAPIRLKGRLYMSTNALSELLQTKMYWNKNQRKMIIGNLQDKGPINSHLKAQSVTGIRALSNGGTNPEAVINYARNYLGTPYDFGAQPYAESKKFDCSSFTQHVFINFGVNLPRLARDQGNLGTPVTKSNMATGDLVFFRVPGRFNDDNIPGHVGIYMDNGKFIHTWGDPGVQISDLTSGHWAENMLFIRRVL